MDPFRYFLSKKLKIAVISIIVLLVCGGVYSFIQTQHKTYEITLSDTGFVPSTLIIKPGDTVVFKTSLDTTFWPASNIHPEHSLYPAFDPKMPIPKDESWSFAFMEVGRFSFHDHLFPNFTGLIIVSAEDAQEAAITSSINLDINECAKVSEYRQKRQCWDEQLQQAMLVGGVVAAFEYFNELYNTEPDVPKECHGWSHTLGKAGYQYYKEHGDITLDPAASACGFGFYHAFLGELMKDTGDLVKAREFCEHATIVVPSVQTSCKHGIGHGASSIFSENPEYSGNFQKTADSAISICKKIYTEHFDLIECYDGIYNEIYQNILNSRYGYSFEDYRSKNDPYWQCQTQAEEYKESCYVNVVGILPSVFGPDVITAMKYVLSNTHDLEHRGRKIISKIAADRIQETVVDASHQDSIDACALVPDFLYEACFEGILNGFIQHGEPGNLHVKGYAFCNEEGLTKEQKSNCFNSFSSQLRNTYTQEQMKNACVYVQQYSREVPICNQYLL